MEFREKADISTSEEQEEWGMEVVLIRQGLFQYGAEKWWAVTKQSPRNDTTERIYGKQVDKAITRVRMEYFFQNQKHKHLMNLS